MNIEMLSQVYGLLSLALHILIPVVLGYALKRFWLPKTRFSYALKFSLWPAVFFSTFLVGPMPLPSAIKGIIFLSVCVGVFFFIIGWIKGKKKFSQPENDNLLVHEEPSAPELMATTVSAIKPKVVTPEIELKESKPETVATEQPPSKALVKSVPQKKKLSKLSLGIGVGALGAVAFGTYMFFFWDAVEGRQAKLNENSDSQFCIKPQTQTQCNQLAEQYLRNVPLDAKGLKKQIKLTDISRKNLSIGSLTFLETNLEDLRKLGQGYLTLSTCVDGYPSMFYGSGEHAYPVWVLEKKNAFGLGEKKSVFRISPKDHLLLEASFVFDDFAPLSPFNITKSLDQKRKENVLMISVKEADRWETQDLVNDAIKQPIRIASLVVGKSKLKDIKLSKSCRKSSSDTYKGFCLDFPWESIMDFQTDKNGVIVQATLRSDMQRLGPRQFLHTWKRNDFYDLEEAIAKKYNRLLLSGSNANLWDTFYSPYNGPFYAALPGISFRWYDDSDNQITIQSFNPITLKDISADVHQKTSMSEIELDAFITESLDKQEREKKEKFSKMIE